jgi:hypothetical protein
MTAIGVTYIDRREAPLIVMRVERRQLLMTVHGIGGVIDIGRDGLRRPPVALAPQIHHSV